MEIQKKWKLSWVKVFKNEPTKIFGRHPLNDLKGYGLLKQTTSPQFFLKAVFHKFYWVYS